MQQYENYSFEELRFAAPALRRASENILVRCNGNGTYSCIWTPCLAGTYNIHVVVDGFQVLRLLISLKYCGDGVFNYVSV